MLWPAISVFGAFLLLIIFEYVSRTHRKIHSELKRKIVHMGAGCFVATWPFYFKWWEIGLVALMALFVVAMSIQYNIFRSIHSVNRRSFGEILFTIAIGLLAFLDGSPWIFAAAMLHLGLADGLAGVVGTLFAKKSRYKVFGYTKSWLGTATFFVVSLAVTTGYFIATHHFDPALLVAIPILTTMVENFAVFGTDNLFVPLMVAGLLKFF